MNWHQVRAPLPPDALFIDELGIAIGIVGAHRLRTCHRPIYRRDGLLLAPQLLMSSTAVVRDGGLSNHSELLSTGAISAINLERISTRLVELNFHLAEAETLGVYIPAEIEAHSDAGAYFAAVCEFAERLAARRVDDGAVVYELNGDLLETEQIVDLASRLHAVGARVSIAVTSIASPLSTWVEAAEPDMVRLTGEWAAAAFQHQESRQLLSPFVRGSQALGVKVLIDDVNSERLLMAASELGVDYLAGDRLHEAVIAGSIIKHDAIQLAFDDSASIIPFRQRASR